MINHPTHTSNSSCTDLILTPLPNLVVESCIHLSLHLNYHHQFIFAKLKLEIKYPPPYYHQVWHYQEPDAKLIRQAIDLSDWKKSF